MKKNNHISTWVLLFAFLAAGAGISSAYAQAATPIAVPLLYDAQPQTQPNAIPVNSGNTVPLPAGTYYNQAGQQISYYGNGTYYNASTQTYGGTVADPSGTAGVFVDTSVAAAAPGAPNTGIGGFNVASNWSLLIASAVIFAGSLLYSASRRIFS